MQMLKSPGEIEKLQQEMGSGFHGPRKFKGHQLILLAKDPTSKHHLQFTAVPCMNQQQQNVKTTTWKKENRACIALQKCLTLKK